MAACVAIAALACASAAPADRILLIRETSGQAQVSPFEGMAAYLARHGFGPERLRIDRLALDSDAKGAPDALRAALAGGPFRVIVTANMALAQLAQRVDAKTPIVFGGAADPVQLCLVRSLVHPGTNATGQTTYLPMAAKMIEALRDAYPRLARAVVLVDGGKDEDDEPPCGEAARAEPPTRAGVPPCRPGIIARPEDAGIDELAGMLDYGGRYGLALVFHRICKVSDLAGLAAYASPSGAAGVVVPFEYPFFLHREAVIEQMEELRLPAVYARKVFAQDGGLIALSPVDPGEVRVFELVVQVLRGADPGSLPVQVGSGFEVWINVATARSLGMAPSLHALTRAERLLD